jgi:hypothetical protein
MHATRWCKPFTCRRCTDRIPLPAGHEVIIQQEGSLHPRHRRGQPGRVDAIEPGQSDYANGNTPFAEKLISTISGAARQYQNARAAEPLD